MTMDMNSIRAHKYKSISLGLTLVFFLFVMIESFGLPGSANAQVPYVWSRPQQIPEYYDLLNPPLMVADSNHTVHAFDLEFLGGNVWAVMYRRWSLQLGWSSPVDILLPASLGVAPSLLDVALDQHGYFHVLYFGGTQQEGTIYHSKALAVEAGSSKAWSDPVPITTDAGPLHDAQISIRDSELVVVFSGQRYGSGIYEIHSVDHGYSWSTQTLVHRSHDVEINPGEIRLESDPDGQVHAVWHMDNVSGLAEETWYARLSSDLSKWEYLQKLSQKDDDLEFNGEPSIVVNEDELLVFFYDDFPPTRFMRRSGDGGKSWSTPVRPFPHSGGYGQVSFSKDSLGTIHILLGNRLQNPEIHGMWYSRLIENAWLPLDPIVSGPSTDTFAPTKPETVVVQGNLLLAVWSHDVRGEFRSAPWFSYIFVDAPELPEQQLPTQPISIQVADQRGPEISTTPSPTAHSGFASAPASGSAQISSSEINNPGGVILFGSAPVVILLLVVIYARKRKH